MDNLIALQGKFHSLFGSSCNVYRAPGRVNLIGEHTDYNDGFVLPAPIAFSCWVCAAPRNDRKLVIHSENFGMKVESELDAIEPGRSGDWADYAIGTAWALEQAGYLLRGANIYLRGDVPLGAGLSSSAAIEVAVGFALLDLSGHPVDRIRLAQLCQRAENEFVGARCGIMDQFVSCHGRSGSALLLNCRSLEYEFVPVPREIQLVVCNTMVKHQLAAGEYNLRRAECEEATRKLSSVLPNVRALRDVTPEQLEHHRSLLTETLHRRCRHIVSENDRVLKAAAALQKGEVRQFGELMRESHRSLRNDYEVSCDELDLMVELALKQDGVHGARMTGGGFGGCTVNLVNRPDAQSFKNRVAEGYYSSTGRHPDIYLCEIGDGAARVPLDTWEKA